MSIVFHLHSTNEEKGLWLSEVQLPQWRKVAELCLTPKQPLPSQKLATEDAVTQHNRTAFNQKEHRYVH